MKPDRGWLYCGTDGGGKYELEPTASLFLFCIQMAVLVSRGLLQLQDYKLGRFLLNGDLKGGMKGGSIHADIFVTERQRESGAMNSSERDITCGTNGYRGGLVGSMISYDSEVL